MLWLRLIRKQKLYNYGDKILNYGMCAYPVALVVVLIVEVAELVAAGFMGVVGGALLELEQINHIIQILTESLYSNISVCICFSFLEM